MATLDEVMQETRDQTTAHASVSKLMAGIRDQVKGALSAINIPPSVQDKIDEIFTDLVDNDVKLVAAIWDNVPVTDPKAPVFNPEDPNNPLVNDPDEPNYNPKNPTVKRSWVGTNKDPSFNPNKPKNPNFNPNQPTDKHSPINDPAEPNFNPNQPIVKRHPRP